MLEIVAIETTTDIHFVRIIAMKGIKAIGKSVKNAGEISKLKCMCGMEPTSIILKSLRIHPGTNRQSAQNVKKLSILVKTAILCLKESIFVENAKVLNYKRKQKELYSSSENKNTWSISQKSRQTMTEEWRQKAGSESVS